jgi:16S rRNA (uracil1498-N3)-methyltransferase
MNHFFVDPKLIIDDHVNFVEDISHQICRVLRLKVDDQVTVLDNLGNQFEVKLVNVDPHECLGKILLKKTNTAEPMKELHLFIAMTQREKFELILQKCCEIGVSQFTPIITERSIVVSVNDFQKKRERWERILKEAAEQSRRGKIPKLNDPEIFQKAVLNQNGFNLIAWEKDENSKIETVFSGFDGQKVSLMIGPEGGFSENEINLSIKNNWQPISLGKRILRMETAAMVTSALVLNAIGEL